MPRRPGHVRRREIAPDVVYGSIWAARFINKLMHDGDKSIAQRAFREAMDIIRARSDREPQEVFEQAVRNSMPMVEVKPRRVGGATYQVPIEVRPERRLSLAMRWLLSSARSRSGRPICERLATELMEAAGGQGATIKRRDDVHRMAEANRAFAHYRW